MPRKPKQQKHTITVLVNDSPVPVILHPPSNSRTSCYAYWNGLVASRSTGHCDLSEAIKTAEDMVRRYGEGGTGQRATLADAVLSDAEFEEIQRQHFQRKHDPDARRRAERSLYDCLVAIDAFQRIVEVRPITRATADDCARFQREALKKSKNWRRLVEGKEAGGEKVGRIKANTVRKWSRELQAAWNRANRNAGKKCVRDVVDERKLLTENPWEKFTWVEGKARAIRPFDGDELLGFLNWLAVQWSGVTVATAMAKVYLWSACRREEVMTLSWPSLRQVGGEHHFKIVGKWGVEKWFRVPDGVYRELLDLKTDSDYVFAAYPEQLRPFYEGSQAPWKAKLVSPEFKPANLGDWFCDRIIDWSATLPNGHATTHIFRKTTMQYVRRGEEINQQVANDVRVNANVMMTHYVQVTDEERRQESNRNYQRLLASLTPEVARHYGHVTDNRNHLEGKLKAAVAGGDWTLAARISSELAKGQRSAAG